MERRSFFRTALVASAVVGVEASRASSANAFFWFFTLCPPSLCVVDTTFSTVKLNVKAGILGAAAGFTVQWMKKADYIANCKRWYNECDPRLCQAVFSAKDCWAPYSLSACKSVTVEIGNLPGNVTTNCPGPLNMGTEYIFRAFAHGYGFYCRSDYSCDVCATTKIVGPPPT